MKERKLRRQYISQQSKPISEVVVTLCLSLPCAN